mmetsp:Transcript_11294/g.15823  ORF Transcript_11294/g.15823 Transcript_11294/m.15823 type:complete len:108 (+) Transcript_11294:1347-1670(+)
MIMSWDTVCHNGWHENNNLWNASNLWYEENLKRSTFLYVEKYRYRDFKIKLLELLGGYEIREFGGNNMRLQREIVLPDLIGWILQYTSISLQTPTNDTSQFITAESR